MPSDKSAPISNPATPLPQVGSRWRDLTRRVWSGVGDLVLPPVCQGCHAPLASHDALCAACWSQIDFIRPPVCDRLGLPLSFDPGGVALSAGAIADPPVYDRARAVAHHSGLMRRLVHDLKFHDRDNLVDLLGGFLVVAGRALLEDADLVVPVPLGRLRLLQRRFNQAARLAQNVSRRSGVPFDALSLVRTRRTARQVGLTRTERLANVRNAFAVPEERRGRIDGKRIVLVDDVITTGATVSAAARALRNAGAVQIDVLALALVTGEELSPG